MKKLSYLTLLVLTACAPSAQEREALVLSRASYDLNCPKEQIKLTKLQDDSGVSGNLMASALFGAPYQKHTNAIKFGAEGCGKKEVYDSVSDGVYKEGTAPAININPTRTIPIGR
jgi:hypothetical protein